MNANDTEREILLLASNSNVSLYDVENDELYEDIGFFEENQQLEGKYLFGLIGMKAVLGDYNPETTFHDGFIYDLLTKEFFYLGECAGYTKSVPIIIENRMYVTQLDQVWYVDVEEKTAKVCATFENDHSLGSGQINDVVYGVGSINWCFKSVPTKSFLESTKICESYDTKTGEVKTIASIPFPETKRRLYWWQRQIPTCELNGKLYAIDNYTLENLYVYSPEDDQWETIKIQMPPPIEGGILVACNEKLICVDERCIFYTFDFDLNQWNGVTHHNGALLRKIYRVQALSSKFLNYLLKKDED